MVKGMKELYLAGGCFWTVQEYLRRIDGVIKTEVTLENRSTHLYRMGINQIEIL